MRLRKDINRPEAIRHAVKVRFGKFLIRVRVALDILFVHDHFALLTLDRDELVKLFKDQEFNVSVTTHGLQPYIVRRMIARCATGYDDVDMLLDGVAFSAEAGLRYGSSDKSAQ